MIVCIIKQPLCVVATDSSQPRTFNFDDPKKNVYRFDADKLRLNGGILMAEGGNPQVFAAFHRRLGAETATGGGIDAALKKAPTLMNRAARAWETETKLKQPKVNAANVRDARNTYSVIAGWSEKRKRILAGTVSDDPSFNSLAPENGFLAQCHNMATRRKIEELLKDELFVQRKGKVTQEEAVDLCRKAIAAAAKLEAERTGVKTMGGPVRVVIISGAAAPARITKPEITA